MPSVFTKILKGQEPARFLCQDEHTTAILSSTPVRPGHCIVFPNEEVVNWLELSPDQSRDLMATCQKVGRAIQAVHQPVRVGVAIISIVVPHVHVHLIPINAVADLDLTKQDQNARADDLDASAEAIRAALHRPPASAPSSRGS